MYTAKIEKETRLVFLSTLHAPINIVKSDDKQIFKRMYEMNSPITLKNGYIFMFFSKC